MGKADERPDRDEYREGVSVRNGWRCRLCGRHPKPGQSFGCEGVCPSCRDRIDRLQG
jgi:rubrerythrin